MQRMHRKEKTQPKDGFARQLPAVDRKFRTLEDVKAMVQLKPEEEQLLGILLERRVTPSCLPFGSGLGGLRKRLNMRFWRHTGHEAVRRLTFEGKSASKGMKFLTLNPVLFDETAIPKTVEPGRDFLASDFLSANAQKIQAYISQHERCTLNEIVVATDLAPTIVQKAMDGANKKGRSLGAGPVFGYKRGNPTVYFIGEMFAGTFRIERQQAPIRREAFSEFEWELIGFIYRSTTPPTRQDVMERFRWSADEHDVTVERIEKKCRPYGIDAFDPRIRDLRCLRLSAELEAALGWKRKGNLIDFFDRRHIRLIVFLAEHPGSSADEIAAVVQRNQHYVRMVIGETRRRIVKNHLPPLEVYRGLIYRGRRGCWYRYRLPDAFCRRFGLKKIALPEPVAMMFIRRSERYKEVYAFFNGRPEATLRDAADALGLKKIQVRTRLLGINRYLKRNGERPLRYGLPYRFKGRNFALLQLRAYHAVLGEWPDRTTVEAWEDMSLLDAIERYFGGDWKAAQQAAMKSPLQPERHRKNRIITEYLQRETAELKKAERMDLRFFGVRSEDVRRTIRNAIRNGASTTDMKQILAPEKNGGRTIQLLGALRGPVPKTTLIVP